MDIQVRNLMYYLSMSQFETRIGINYGRKYKLIFLLDWLENLLDFLFHFLQKNRQNELQRGRGPQQEVGYPLKGTAHNQVNDDLIKSTTNDS
jgi:hypothetical protein